MARRFRRVGRDQQFLLPPDVREWLPAGHLAWFVIEVVESLDVAWFAVRVTPRGSAAGRAAYDPRVLLGLLVYGYARGVRSSRRIERACAEDVAFRVICAQDPPDHATIARFRREHFADPVAMEDLFTQVLVLAAGAGLGNLGLIALDGTKIAANAPEDANRTERRLRELARQFLAGAGEADAAEDEMYGDARGDELPPELADPGTRAERIAAALAELEAERRGEDADREAKASAYLARPPAGKVPVAAAVRVAERALAQAVAAQQAKIARWQERGARAREAGGKGATGKAPVPPQEHCRVKRAQARLDAAKARVAQAGRKAARPGCGPVRNITGPAPRLMPVRGGGFIQGYNAQAMHSADGLCLATMVTTATTDYASLTPMIAKAQTAQDVLRAHARGPLRRKKARISTLPADAGYCSEASLTCPGPDRLIATGKRRDLDKAARGGQVGGDAGKPHTAAMAARLTQPQDILTYRRRSPIAETPSGNAKHNRGFRRFAMRGLPRVTGEWAFENTIANLLKIHATSNHPALP